MVYTDAVTAVGRKKIDWDALSYNDKSDVIKKLIGEKPKTPAVNGEADWSPQAERVLKERYFLKDEEGNVTENVADMCWRVAWEMARAEARFGKKRPEIINLAKIFFELLINRNFLPNSPTLMNAGKENNMQYSACYVLPVEDNIEEIFDAIKYQALIHKSGGGTGFSFSRLRPAGSRVRSSMGVASGPISFLKIYNEATQQIKQGGTRRGANMGILRVDHPDILDFIHCKEDGSLTNFNISVAITDAFMKALENDQEYDLYAPETKEGRAVRKKAGTLSAKAVWDEIAKSAWKTGDPGCVFIDRINQGTGNPIKAKGWTIESTNPCGEQMLYPYDACNLGSIFLKYFVKDNNIDWNCLKTTVQTTVRFLDNVIEMNPYPLAQIKGVVNKIRRIGLGVGGWADMLVQLGIPYDSEEALSLAEKVMKFINNEGHKASQELAEKRGPFPLFSKSIYKNKKPMRNSTVTTIAPTGSIGILSDNSGGIEPLFAVSYRHIVKSENRELTFINPFFEEVARQRGFYSQNLMDKVVENGTVRNIDEVPEDVKRIFGTAHEIHPDWHVKMQAAFQKHTDNAVSKTINLPNTATTEEIKKAYMLAWETGCNGITVFRDGSKDAQVLNLGVKEKDGSSVVSEKVWERPMCVSGSTYKMKTPVGTAFITVNQDVIGNPLEVFISIGKAGSDIQAMAEALGRVISKSLQFGGPLNSREKAMVIIDQVRGIGGRRSVGFGQNKILSLPDAVAVALSTHFGFKLNGHIEDTMKKPKPKTFNSRQSTNIQGKNPGQYATLIDTKTTADICPSCGGTSLVYEEGCVKCYACGHSEC